MFRNFLWKFADKRSWTFVSWAQVCSPTETGGWGIPNIFSKAQSLLLKWVTKLDTIQPWTCIVKEKISKAKLLGYTWPNSPWEDKLLCTIKLKVKNSAMIQNLVNSWQCKLQKVRWRMDMRFDSSLMQSIWLCKEAMKDSMPAVNMNPKIARALESKGFAVFRDIWDPGSQEWHVDQTRWTRLKAGEKLMLTQVIQGIKEEWPTSYLVTTEPQISNWDIKRCKDPGPAHSWTDKVVRDWTKEGCHLTTAVCKKKLKFAWKATSSGRLNLLLWRIIARKIPVKVVCSKWGKSSPLCPRCHSSRETVKHALWDCKCVLPMWRSCSRALESFGVTERITWKQAILGIKGRMNPAMLSVWHFIRATLLAKLWHDRNLIAHSKPALNLDPTQIKAIILEGCLLAKDRPKLRTPASILLKKLKKAL